MGFPHKVDDRARGDAVIRDFVFFYILYSLLISNKKKERDLSRGGLRGRNKEALRNVDLFVDSPAQER